MQLVNDDLDAGAWKNIGYFPTPGRLVDDLVTALEPSFAKISGRGTVRVLDACAGDGRLGLAVIERLHELGVTAELTCVEVDSSRIPSSVVNRKDVVWIQENFLSCNLNVSFDIVVSNPPYLSLVKKDAARFGISWNDALDGGRNLYSLAVLKALECCGEGGLVGLIAPHGWINNSSMASFRERLLSMSEAVEVRAYLSRRIFDKVNQDTSIQVIIRRDRERGKSLKSVTIRYGDGEFSPAKISNSIAQYVGMRVRVGPFVWNREKNLISSSARDIRVPAIYGGNIMPWHHLNLKVNRYSNRQYLQRDLVSEGSFSRGPCVLVKRSMRGLPGSWEVDCAYIPSGFEVVVENHVIVIENLGVSEVGVGRLMSNLKYFLQSSCRHQGHPNLSADAVRKALALSEELASAG